MGNNAKKIAYLGMLTALALIFSYVETLIPFNFGIPGIKLGLANIVTLLALYVFGFKESFAILICRIILSGLLFGNMYGILYSLAGGIISLCVMYFIKKMPYFSLISVSISGGVSHNLGQLLVAALLVNQIKIAMYAPVLIIAGLITGVFIGVISGCVLKVVPKCSAK